MTVSDLGGPLCVVDGQVQEEGPWLGSLIRQGPDDEADELYSSLNPPRRRARNLRRSWSTSSRGFITKTHCRSPGAGAFASWAHDHLVEWNRNSLKEHRVGAGVSCLALRGNNAYLAQAGGGMRMSVRSAAI